jgi:glutamine amidotransferase
VVATERGVPLFGNGGGADFYFVHSFAARPSTDDLVLARCVHGESFPAAVGRGAFLGFQFHPEKSGEAGVRLLGAAIEMLKEAER